MQTFLPLPGFVASARALDMKRLGKQRVETLQIMRAITDPTYGWQHHPAVKMWRGPECDPLRYAVALLGYQLAVCSTWTERGGQGDTCLKKTLRVLHESDAPTGYRVPPWYGHEGFHASHRSNLLRKLPEHYRPLWPDDPDDLDYVWPTKAGLMEAAR